MREFDLINDLRQRFTQSPTSDALIVGPGDDCALVRSGPQVLALKVDTTLEGRHFVLNQSTHPANASLEEAGRKALARVLSDIAAMGATPQFAMVAAMLPEGFSKSDALRVDAGMRELADSCGVMIVGGDTTLSTTGLGLSVSMVGSMEGREPLLRAAAKAGDVLRVTGSLGASIKGKHLRFQPRLDEGRWLSEFGVRCAIDISDGLSGDLMHLLRESGPGLCATLDAGLNSAV